MNAPARFDGTNDLRDAIAVLAQHLPPALAPLAAIAYNYAWSWSADGPKLFRDVDPHRWELCGENPVRFLQEASHTSLAVAAAGPDLVERVRAAAKVFDGPVPPAPDSAVFLSTEFAVHRSLPVYAGGLGVLAGDVLKEASDRGMPVAGVGLFYRQGYFHQRIDAGGWQHEYWMDADPERCPAALVRDANGATLTVSVRIRGRDVAVQVWRVDVGSVPLFLLDAELPQNHHVDRWITSRLYIGDRTFRLAQYALLGVGGIRALNAMGIDPRLIHLNEGHVAFAPLELARALVASGRTFEDAMRETRARTVFTTHTPVAAGNEAYTAHEVLEVIDDLPAALGVDAKEVLALGRANPHDMDEPFGMTPLGLRVSRTANAVSAKHGEVSRGMWRHLFDGETVPITHVTNGVHLPSWMAAPVRSLLDRHLGEGWIERAADPATWDGIGAIPDAELWETRRTLRARLIDYVRERAARDRLGRGEPIGYVEAATQAFNPDVLTIGFARRATGYKRLHLLTSDAQRALRLLDGPHSVQLVLAGKPHPQDDEGKRLVQGVFEFKWAPHVAERVAYLEDYDLGMAQVLVSGCDVWVNVPRPPLEACGTSGMKAALNGALNLSVLDGWWDEAFDGSNGWAITSHPTPDHHGQDAQDAAALYDVIEHDAIPLFYDRDEAGVPRGWCRRVKDSLRSIGPRFNATRMMAEYARDIYQSE